MTKDLLVGTGDLAVAIEVLLVATENYSLAKALDSPIAYSFVGWSWARKGADSCLELCMVCHSPRCVELFLEAWEEDWPYCVVLVAFRVRTLY